MVPGFLGMMGLRFGKRVSVANGQARTIATDESILGDLITRFLGRAGKA